MNAACWIPLWSWPWANSAAPPRSPRFPVKKRPDAITGQVRCQYYLPVAARRQARSSALTDVRGYAAIERVLSPESFVSTVYRKLGIDPNKIYHTPQGRPVHLVSDPTPIKELMG